MFVATTTTGVPSASSAIGPCFISPAEYASVGMYEISFSLSAPSSATGRPMWRPGQRQAGLGDPDHERVLRQHRVPVDPLARDVGLDRHTRPFLEDVAAHDGRVVGGPAGDDHDPAQVADLELAHAERFEHEPVAADAVAD